MPFPQPKSYINHLSVQIITSLSMTDVWIDQKVI